MRDVITDLGQHYTVGYNAAFLCCPPKVQYSHILHADLMALFVGFPEQEIRAVMNRIFRIKKTCLAPGSSHILSSNYHYCMAYG